MGSQGPDIKKIGLTKFNLISTIRIMDFFGEPGTPPFTQALQLETAIGDETAQAMRANVAWQAEVEMAEEAQVAEEGCMAEMAEWLNWPFWANQEEEAQMALWADSVERAAKSKKSAQAIRLNR